MSGRATKPWLPTLALHGAGLLLVLLVALPLLGVALGTSLADLRAGLGQSLVGQALRLSLLTTTLSLAVNIALGTPLAWLVATRPGRAFRLAELIVHLPAVIPPAVAGLALLLAFGRQGLLGRVLPLPFTTAAVVVAEVFVSCPFYVQAATAAFRQVDRTQLAVARSLGASPWQAFVQVVMPLALPGLLAGAALAWSRALGEFGATLMFAGNLPGRTQTLPLAMYAALETDVRAAQALALLMILVAASVLLTVRRLAPAAARGLR
jgi:molybdate transport system permease protein